MRAAVPSQRPQIAETLPDYMQWERVPALVGHRPTESLVAYPASEEACRETMAFCQRNGLSICVRGGGYSYGDMIQNDRNVLLATTRMNRILDFDEAQGFIRVQPGVRLIDIYKRVHHLLFTLGASPSESSVTVAGAIGTNVNGKEGWRLGHFGDQVESLKLLTANGELLRVSRDENTELFRAVVGGMGLLGIIVEATLKLQPIPSPLLHVSRIPVANVDELLTELEEVETTSDFAVVWLDTAAKGPRLGRAVVHATSWVERKTTPEELQAQVAESISRLGARIAQVRKMRAIVGLVVSFMLNFQRLTVPAFNKFYYRYSLLRRRLNKADNVESFLRYNFDASFMIPSAAAVCGRRGYTVQLSFPKSQARSAITALVGLCQASPCLPPKVIMRLHRSDDHLISFSQDGYSMNLEFHPKGRHEKRMLLFVDELVACVVRLGGRVHLAKDMVLTRSQFQKLFPLYGDFMAIKSRLDPGTLFQSDMYRRLMKNQNAKNAVAPEYDRSQAVKPDLELQ